MDIEKDVKLVPQEEYMKHHCAKYPAILLTYRQAWDEAVTKVEDLKQQLKNLEAELTIVIKSKPMAFFESAKYTLKDLSAAVNTDPEVRRAKRAVKLAEKELTTTYTNLKAMEAKGRSLDNLAKLFSE